MMEDIQPNEYIPNTLFDLSEEDLFNAIRDRVEYLLEKNPEILMSYLYRLDVLEVKIKAILSPKSPINPIDGLAHLILERQKERVKSKKKYKSRPIPPGWEF